MEKLNVAIADDNEKMVEVLGRMIEEDKDLELVGKAHNGEEICSIIKEKEPDVVVLDIIMPKVDGLSVWSAFIMTAPAKKRLHSLSCLLLDRSGSQRMHLALGQITIC